MYDVSQTMDGIMNGKALIIIQDLADNETQRANSALLLKFANSKNELFKSYFTVNGGAPDLLIREEVDMELYLTEHKHPLEKMASTNTAYMEENYITSAAALLWYCRYCRKEGKDALEHHFCKLCRYSLCEECIELVGQTVPEEEKNARMVCLDFTAGKYFKPHEDKADISEENLQAFAEDITSGKVEEV